MISATKSTLGNPIQSRSLAGAIHWLKYGTESKSGKRFWKNFFELMNNSVYKKYILGYTLWKHRDIKLVTSKQEVV